MFDVSRFDRAALGAADRSPAGRRGRLLRGVVVVSLVLFLACSRGPDPSGRWTGRLDVTQGQGLPPRMAVALVLERHGKHVSGSMSWRDEEGADEGLRTKEFHLKEGVYADGRLFFTASSLLATGEANAQLYGTVTEERLDGELTLSVVSTLGNKEFKGHLTARRR